MKSYLLTLLLFLACFPIWGQVSSKVLSLGLPYLHEKKIYQDLFFKNDGVKVVAITITCFDVTKEKDSIQVFSIKAKTPKSKRKDIFHINTHLNIKENGSSFNPKYKEVILKNKSLPAGNYRTYLALHFEDSIVKRTFIQYVDSALNISSTARKVFDNTYNPQGRKSFLGISLSSPKATSKFISPRSVIKKSSKKINKQLNSKGFIANYREIGSETFADVYYQDIYVGYYEINMNAPIDKTINMRKARLGSNITTGVNGKLENNEIVFSQMRGLHGEKKKKEGVGNISFTDNVTTGQEENSQAQNNYYEIAGQVEVPIMNVPVSFEGYYTSQDNYRVAKASYFKLHYDSEQAKAELLQLIAGYNNKYDESVSRGKGMNMVYGTYLSNLQVEKNKLWAEIMAETDIADISQFKVDTSGLFKKITKAFEGKITDSTALLRNNGDDNKSAKIKNGATQRYNKAMDKYKQIQEVEKKINYYNTLLEQYRNNNYFDSVMAYDKLKDITNESADGKTYKQLAKSAGSFLPEGNKNKFITGLTSLDIGIFSKQISGYTLNGQTIKGIDVGYDLGLCEMGLTYGRVEYISRDGQLDKYSGYSGRASFRPGKKQKTTLIYYGYMPSKKMLNESDFFKEVDAYMPAFKAPIHIVSVVHNGAITNHVNMEAEVATSYRATNEFQRNGVNVTDKMSYRMNVDGNIPQTAINLKGGYEHVGNKFENNTLPLNLSGTERYSAGANGYFFKNFLSLGIEYNYIIQQNFASKSANSKWGFEIKTTSKRYPSASLSYKPYTTFQTFLDTLNIPQRPILGEVWLGKLSYQIKNKTYMLRLTAIYNRNTALVDTMESNSNVTQINVLYAKGRVNLMLNAGQTQMKANEMSSVHSKTNFLTIAAAYAINSQWNINGGQDIGVMRTGLSKYAVNFGCGYRFKNVPLSIRTSFRYNTYKLDEGQAWKNIYAGMLDVNWQFRFKMKEKI